MDLALLAGEPEDIRVGGVTLKVSPATPRQAARLQAWLDEHAPRPGKAGTRLRDLPPTAPPQLVQAVAKGEAEALKGWEPPDVFTAAGVKALLGAEEGQVEFLVAALGRHHPDVDRATAAAMLDAMGAWDLRAISRSFLGHDGVFDPKEMVLAALEAGAFPSDGATPAPTSSAGASSPPATTSSTPPGPSSSTG